MANQFEPGTFYFADGTVDPYPYANIANKPPSYRGGPPTPAGRMRQNPVDFLKDVLGLFGMTPPKKGGGSGQRPQPTPGPGSAMQDALYNSPAWLITR